MLLKKNKDNIYCFLDFESTGVPAEDHYPIQIGVIFTDNLFRILDTYENYVFCKDLFDNYNLNGKIWPEPFASSEKYHRISLLRYMLNFKKSRAYMNGLYQREIEDDINKKMNNITSKYYDIYNINKIKFILVSDNIQFEWQMIKQIYKTYWPFHYCGWDTSLLLETVGLGDPKNVPHDAFMDASMLHMQVVRTLDKLGYFEE